MYFRITGDFSDETEIEQELLELSGSTKRHFDKISYGSDLTSIVLVLVCHGGNEHIPRVRRSNKENKIYADIILNYNEIRISNDSQKRKIIVTAIFENVSKIIQKYKLTDFDIERFNSDLEGWLNDFANKE